MKKATNKTAIPAMRENYDFAGGVRGKYARRYAQGTNVVLLEPDVAKAFPSAAAVPIKTLLFLLSSAVLIGCSEKTTSGEQQQQSLEPPQLPAKQEQPLTLLQRTERDAAQGDAKAQWFLGIMLAIGNDPALFPNGLPEDFGKGDLVQKDEAKAFEWMQKSADQGYVPAQEQLGAMFFTGMGTPKDEAKAVVWMEKAASQGDETAQVKLAIAYAQGLGVPKNAVKGAEWLKKSASQGNVVAQGFLAMAYMEGTGVPKDEAKAAEWTEKAAMQGDTDAQTRLGGMYGLGKGVPKDEVRAYAWLNLVAAQGKNNASQTRDVIEKLMTSEQKAEAQKLSAALFTKIKKPTQ